MQTKQPIIIWYQDTVKGLQHFIEDSAMEVQWILNQWNNQQIHNDKD